MQSNAKAVRDTVTPMPAVAPVLKDLLTGASCREGESKVSMGLMPARLEDAVVRKVLELVAEDVMGCGPMATVSDVALEVSKLDSDEVDAEDVLELVPSEIARILIVTSSHVSAFRMFSEYRL